MGKTGVLSLDERVCRVGMYLRISREDDLSEESVSIVNQRDFLTRFIDTRGWTLVDIYQDDGFSGTDFDRPSFKAMIRDIEKGRINTIVTKDLSRLGRDYIGTGYFLEKYFPEHNVRYVAVNDGIDTFNSGSSDDMTPFRAVINDLYAKDISKKVRSVLDSKRRSGQFIGSFAPYGYKKHPEDKNRLVIDEEAAQTVRLIFDLYIRGYGYSRISKALNEMGVPCPAVYKASNCNYQNPMLKQGTWTHETVRKILMNPTYAGDMAQGKYKKLSYKIKKQINIPADNWIVIKDAHPAIIERAVYEEAQNILKGKGRGYCSKPAVHPLAGLLYCGDCGERMTLHNSKGSSYFICAAYRRLGKSACTSHLLGEKKVEEYIYSQIDGLVKEQVTAGIGSEYNRLLHLPETSKPLIRKLIGRITVFEADDEKRVIIDYNFSV